MAVNKKTQMKVVIGPTEPIEGSNPPNPAETLRTGQLGTRTFPQFVARRNFTIPTKSILHRDQGPSNDQFNQPGYEEGVGVDANKYSEGENPAITKEGVPI